jgi:sugar lactone lactonase YvrE
MRKTLIALCLCELAGRTAASAQTTPIRPFRIATIAGTPYDPTGDGKPAAVAMFSPNGVVWSDGNLYLTDGGRIRRISPNGTINTVVGLLDPVVHQTISGYSGDGGPALGAQVRGATSLRFDTAGNLYIADAGNACIRKLTARTIAGIAQPIDGTETISTYAGTCTAPGNSNGSGTALTAKMAAPRDIAFDAAGILYVADQTNNNIRAIDATGNIVTVAGSGTAGSDDGPAAVAKFKTPTSVAVNPATGDLFVADFANNRIRRVSGGNVTTFAGTGASSSLGGLNEGGAAAAANITPVKLRFLNGVLYVLDAAVGMVRKIDASGVVTTVAGIGLPAYNGPFPPVGDGGSALAAKFGNGAGGVQDIAFDISGNAFVTDASTLRLRSIPAAGSVSTIAGPGGVTTFSGDGGAASAARLFNPKAPVFDAAGEFYFNDQGNERIRKIDTSGLITTAAGNGVIPPAPPGFSGVPGLATAASILPLGAVAAGPNGIYFGNNNVSILELTGVQLSVSPNPAANVGGLAFDASGNLYVSDPVNLLVWKVDAAGNAKSVVGGGSIVLDPSTAPSASAKQVRLTGPLNVLFDPAGNLYVNEFAKNRILKVAAHAPNQTLDGTETVTIYAGNGTAVYPNDGLPAASVALSGPGGPVFDAKGNLFLTETATFRVRVVDTNGIISTVAGTGTPGFTGDGGPALAAQIRGGPLAVDAAGNVFMSDSVNNVVRVLDNTPPVISGMPGADCSIWPPNKKMVQVATVTAMDSGSGLVAGSFTVTGTSNEPGDGQISIAVNSSGGYNVSLEADRSGNGNGRTYTLTATARDLAGNMTTVSATCTVPHDRGN